MFWDMQMGAALIKKLLLGFPNNQQILILNYGFA